MFLNITALHQTDNQTDNLIKKTLTNHLTNKGFTICLAVRTRLELATPCVTGMYSNQTELPDLFAESECKYIPFFLFQKKNIIFFQKN